MARNPDVAIIVPVYNSQRYLPLCLESISAQTFQNFELILIDDGSTDESGRICDEFEAEHSMFSNRGFTCQVFHQVNAGQSSARNKGVQRSCAPWITFIDSDDYVHPRFLELLLSAVQKGKSDIIMCHAVIPAPVNPASTEQHYDLSIITHNVDEAFFLEMYKDKWEKRGYMNEVIWGKLLKRTIPEAIELAEERIFEDSAVMCRWFDLAGSVCELPYPLYYYTNNPSGTVNAPFSIKKLDRLWSAEETEHFYRTKKYTRMTELSQRNYCFQALNLEKECGITPENKAIRKRIVFLRRRKFWRNIWHWQGNFHSKYDDWKTLCLPG